MLELKLIDAGQLEREAYSVTEYMDTLAELGEILSMPGDDWPMHPKGIAWMRQVLANDPNIEIDYYPEAHPAYRTSFRIVRHPGSEHTIHKFLSAYKMSMDEFGGCMCGELTCICGE